LESGQRDNARVRAVGLLFQGKFATYATGQKPALERTDQQYSILQYRLCLDLSLSAQQVGRPARVDSSRMRM
jgi:hypothetical protein